MGHYAIAGQHCTLELPTCGVLGDVTGVLMQTGPGREQTGPAVETAVISFRPRREDVIGTVTSFERVTTTYVIYVT
ncbi:unnamed protein product, partial [Iphiclides podalirius]